MPRVPPPRHPRRVCPIIADPVMQCTDANWRGWDGSLQSKSDWPRSETLPCGKKGVACLTTSVHLLSFVICPENLVGNGVRSPMLSCSSSGSIHRQGSCRIGGAGISALTSLTSFHNCCLKQHKVAFKVALFYEVGWFEHEQRVGASVRILRVFCIPGLLSALCIVLDVSCVLLLRGTNIVFEYCWCWRCSFSCSCCRCRCSCSSASCTVLVVVLLCWTNGKSARSFRHKFYGQVLSCTHWSCSTELLPPACPRTTTVVFCFLVFKRYAMLNSNFVLVQLRIGHRPHFGPNPPSGSWYPEAGIWKIHLRILMKLLQLAQAARRPRPKFTAHYGWPVKSLLVR